MNNTPLSVSLYHLPILRTIRQKNQSLTSLKYFIQNLSNFLEVEIITEKPDKSVLFDFLRQIDIQNKDIVEKGYISLFLEQMGSSFAKYIKN